jgi:peptidyl-prolyl cis-trans isomerase A (cyclophilin A)
MIKYLLAALVSLPLLAQAQNTAAAKDAAAATNPRVVLHTTMGDITLELDAAKAPKSAANFVQYVNEGHYNGTVFHRIIDGFMVQGGGFDADLKQKPARAAITNEANNGLSNLRGTIAMARTNDPHSATAQFFINVVDNRRLDHISPSQPMTWGYAVFGKVVEGMDVVDRMKAVETGPMGPFPSDVPKTPILIEKAEVLKSDASAAKNVSAQ